MKIMMSHMKSIGKKSNKCHPNQIELQAMIYSLLDEPKPFSITSGDGVRST
jgi:hypothetical protein